MGLEGSIRWEGDTLDTVQEPHIANGPNRRPELRQLGTASSPHLRPTQIKRSESLAACDPASDGDRTDTWNWKPKGAKVGTQRYCP